MLPHLLPQRWAMRLLRNPDTPRAGRNTSALHDVNEGAEQDEIFKGPHANPA